MVYKPIARTARRGFLEKRQSTFLRPPFSAPREEFFAAYGRRVARGGQEKTPRGAKLPEAFPTSSQGLRLLRRSPCHFLLCSPGKRAFFSRRFRQSSPQRFFRDRARRLCSTILPVVRPNRSSRAGTEPTSPNSSSTPTRSTGSGYSLQSSSHTAEYSPPMTL